MNYRLVHSLKGEFEAEGLSREDLCSEVIFAANKSLDYLVKVSGSEAKSDYSYLEKIGVTSIVCPMVESSFGMTKYMSSIEGKLFSHIGVTIETKTASDKIKDILSAGSALDNVTIGRSDLAASLNIKDVESKEICYHLEKIAYEGKAQGLTVSIGGTITSKTRNMLCENMAISDLIDYVETRKAVFEKKAFLENDAISLAFDIEKILLERRAKHNEEQLDLIKKRLAIIEFRKSE